MKKFVFIFIVIMLSALTVAVFLYAINCKKQIQILNDEIVKLNDQIVLISSQNEKLSEDNNFLQKQYQDLKLTKNKSELIDVEIQECMKSCNYTTACMNNCVYDSIPKWEKEITNNIKLLEKIMNKEQIELLHDSQKKWIIYKDSQQKLNSETVGTKIGTIYTNILATDQQYIIKRRANELKNLYSIYSRK